MSRQKRVTKDDLRKLIEWLAGDDCGLSSTTIACVMTGAACRRPAIPYDAGDFGRCHRLLERFPGFRKRLDEVAAAYPEWRPIVAVWRELPTPPERPTRCGACCGPPAGRPEARARYRTNEGGRGRRALRD